MTRANGDDTRIETLSALEEILRQLVLHHGARVTLGEMLAITAAMARFCTHGRVTIAEIAEATGLPKQSISRWAQKRLGESLVLQMNDDDGRVRDLSLMDDQRGRDNIARLAEIMKIDRDRPHSG
jgi:DNA-binding transcriptional ArsR family regulator